LWFNHFSVIKAYINWIMQVHNIPINSWIKTIYQICPDYSNKIITLFLLLCIWHFLFYNSPLFWLYDVLIFLLCTIPHFIFNLRKFSHSFFKLRIISRGLMKFKINLGINIVLKVVMGTFIWVHKIHNFVC
jgi:hypothetical protein